MNRYSKPYLAYGEQVALLADRGMVIADIQEAERLLSVIGYYRLSGHWYPFRAPIAPGQRRSSEFVPGTDLKHVLALYDMDRRLKLLVLDAIERVEIAVRVRLGHTLGERDPYAHLDPEQLDGRFSAPKPDGRPCDYDEWLRRVTEAQRRSKEDFVQHFARQYDGRLPIWALTEIRDFGSLSYLYAGAKREDRDRIAADFSIRDREGVGNGAALTNWMHVLNYLRNTCAHHSRLWNRNITVQIATKHLRHLPDLAHLATGPAPTGNRIYGPLTVLAFLLSQIHDESGWTVRVGHVLNTGLPNARRDITEMGFPPDWESVPVWHSC